MEANANAIQREPLTPARFGLSQAERQRIDALIRHASTEQIDVADRLRQVVGAIADRARMQRVPPEQLLAALKDTFKAAAGRGGAAERVLLEQAVTWCIGRYYGSTGAIGSTGNVDGAGRASASTSSDIGRAD